VSELIELRPDPIVTELQQTLRRKCGVIALSASSTMRLMLGRPRSYALCVCFVVEGLANANTFQLVVDHNEVSWQDITGTEALHVVVVIEEAPQAFE